MLPDVFIKINATMLEFETMDPNTVRFDKVEHVMSELLKCCREIYKVKRLQSKLHVRVSFRPLHPCSSPLTIQVTLHR